LECGVRSYHGFMFDTSGVNFGRIGHIDFGSDFKRGSSQVNGEIGPLILISQ